MVEVSITGEVATLTKYTPYKIRMTLNEAKAKKTLLETELTEINAVIEAFK